VTIRVALEHQTTYRFDREVGIGPHIVRLRPAPHCRTPIVSYALRVEPGSHFLNWQQDAFGNFLARLVFPEPASELSFTVDLVADLTVINPFDFFMEEDSEHYPVHYGSAASDLAPYLAHDESGPLLDAYVAHFEPMCEGEPRMVDLLVEINQQIQSDIAYTTRMEPGVQSPDETLEKALGSCRDSGWLMVAVLRRLGLAARFVSGYLVQLTADQKPLDGPAGPTAHINHQQPRCCLL
jgi:transglutaminase-like putative cysteine protease